MISLKIWSCEEQKMIDISNQFEWVKELYQKKELSIHLLHSFCKYFDDLPNSQLLEIFDLNNLDMRKFKKLKSVGKKTVDECLELYDRYNLNYINL
jgi:hypothetical protein